MKKKALITGIGGQDGSYLAEFLLEKNYTVYGILPRRSSPELQTLRIEKILSKIVLCYGDILDKSNIDEIVKRIKPHEVYHRMRCSIRVSSVFYIVELQRRICFSRQSKACFDTVAGKRVPLNKSAATNVNGTEKANKVLCSFSIIKRV